MMRTPFPTNPVEVVPLTIIEFTFEVDMADGPSFDDVCRRFGNDANRALVCLIRFRALKTWRNREGTAKWLSTGSRSPQDLCEVAARFELNDRWEFDADAFCLAVDRAVRQRS